MTLQQIIEILQDISVQHPEINSFHTGKAFQENDSNINYPSLRVVFPYSVTYAQDNRIMEVSLNLKIMVTEYEEEVGTTSKYINTNYYKEEDKDEQFTITNENKMRDRALGIANQVLETLKEQERVYDYFEITDFSMKALERATNDVATGVHLKVVIRTDNVYRCEYPNLLDPLYVDTSNMSPCPPEPAKPRYALAFNGVNEDVVVAQQNATIYDNEWTSPQTIEAWMRIKPSTGSNRPIVCAKNELFAGYLFLGLTSGVLRYQIRAKNPFNLFDAYSQTQAPIDEWFHAMVVYDGSGDGLNGVQFYINGVASPLPNNWSQGQAVTQGTSLNNQPFEVGAISSFGLWGNQDLGLVRLWNGVALNQNEVQQLYNGGKPQYDNIPQVPFLKYDCRMGDEGWFGSNDWVMRDFSRTVNFTYTDNMDLSNRIDFIQ